MANVLLLVAEPDRREFLAGELAADMHSAVVACSRGEAVLASQTQLVDVAIVGLALPDHAALRLIREIRAAEHPDLRADLPILAMLAPDGDELQVLRAFEVGADDVTPPETSYAELRCRLASLLRRSHGGGGSARRRRLGSLQLDIPARQATVGDTRVELSKLEFELLSVLTTQPTKVFPKAELLRDIWGMPQGVTTRTLDSHACRLRRKLADAGAHGLVATCRGYGYALMAAGSSAT